MGNETITLIRYEVIIEGDRKGIFRLPQDPTILDDESLELYEEFYYNELPFVDLGDDATVEFYFTLYGEEMQNECRYVSSTVDCIPNGYKSVELIRNVIEIDPNDTRIAYQDSYQVALKKAEKAVA